MPNISNLSESELKLVPIVRLLWLCLDELLNEHL